MTGPFYLQSGSLPQLAGTHEQVAGGLAQLAGARTPQASDVAKSFGTIAFNLNTSLDGALHSRTGTIQTTQRSSDTIAGLLSKAHTMYSGGDQRGADNITSVAQAMPDHQGGQPGSGALGIKHQGDGAPAATVPGRDSTPAAAPGSSGAPPAAGASGAPTAQGSSGTPIATGTPSNAGLTAAPTSSGDSAGAGSQAMGQVLGQVGQQMGSMAQAVGQGFQGMGQTLGQLPQQVMQAVSQFSELGGAGDHGALGGSALVADDLSHRPDSPDDHDHRPDPDDPRDHSRDDDPRRDPSDPSQPQPPQAEPSQPPREPPRTYPAAD